MKAKYITDVFKEFCKERHAEDKGKNYNLLQEIYSKTELFNLSYLNQLKEGGTHAQIGWENNNFIVSFEGLKDMSLPFENIFVQLDEESRGYVFVREFEPFVYTGTIYMIDNENSKLNLPFTIRTNEGKFYFSEKVIKVVLKSLRHLLDFSNVKMLEQFIGSCAVSVYNCSNIMNNLPKYSVASDTLNKTEYYPRKHDTTLKVSNRPIYYVLDKKEETNPNKLRKIKVLGKMEFTHAFSVRGHWRTLSNNSIGKDRNGEYKVKGFTWVKEHVKGNGELVKRVRILK